MVPIRAEYVWIDGASPVAKLRSKTKILTEDEVSGLIIDNDGVESVSQPEMPPLASSLPVWGFDGSSTEQAPGNSSDCILNPVRVVRDPLTPATPGYRSHLIVLCEVLNSDGTPAKNNNRHRTAKLSKRFLESDEPWFGIEQEYTFFEGHKALGWPEKGYPAPQGPFYCGVGADEVFGRSIVEEHTAACLDARLLLSGVNAEVMPGQWEFQVGAGSPLLVSDHLWLARYLLYRIAERHGVTVRIDPKPVSGDWNGAGCHTNFSTKSMRGVGVKGDEGFERCEEAAKLIGVDYEKNGFPTAYGHGYQTRLTGAHETCSHETFKYGVSDRTASVRIPLHVKKKGKGYIEDRRPCANIDPYEVCSYLMETVCGSTVTVL